MKIKKMIVPIDLIIPGQHYLSKEKYERIKASLHNTSFHGDIYVIRYKNKWFSIDGNHRLYYLYKQSTNTITVINEEDDNHNKLYQTLADESLALGLSHIKDLEPRIISDALFQIKWIDKCQVMLLDEKTIPKYKANPCRYSSLPLYKTIRQNPNNNVRIIHDSLYKGETGTYHQQFLRLKHDLKIIPKHNNCGFKGVMFNKKHDCHKVIDIINTSYDTISITQETIDMMMADRVYNPNLWVFIVDEATDNEVALGIAHHDTLVNEIIIDWIQVLPNYRRQGLGKMLLSHLLLKATSLGEFATVSCDYNNPTTPETLYRSMGFKGEDLWHIIKA